MPSPLTFPAHSISGGKKKEICITTRTSSRMPALNYNQKKENSASPNHKFLNACPKLPTWKNKIIFSITHISEKKRKLHHTTSS
jgi:hypothetical protein